MELYEREFFLSEILFGSKIIEINEDTTIYVNPMTIEQNVYAQRVFKRAYDEALLSGVLTRKEMLELLEEQEIWTKNEEDLLDKLSNKSEDLKLSIYNNFLRKQKRESARKELREVEKKQASLYEKKHSNDHLDCQGIATYARLNWVIENTTTYKDGTPYSFDEIDVTGILKRAGTDTLEPSDYRELARNEPWRSIGLNSNQDAEKALGKSSFELSNAQRNLLSWTRLYDNVSEAYESPHNDIIEDDDALDGWLIQQRKQQEKDKNEKSLESLTSKHQSAEEVYIMSESKQETEQIMSLNGPEGRHTVATRMKAVQKAAEEGNDGVKYQNFPDVRQKIMNQASEQFGKRR